MNVFLKILLISALLIFSISPAYCIDVKDRNEYLWDTRHNDGDIYLNRVSIYKNLKPFDVQISGFGETQWNFDKGNWEKISAGVQLEKYFLKYIYFEESVQFIAGQILDYMSFSSGNQSLEATTKVGFLFPLSKKISLKIWNEYSYNLEKGEAGLNELIVETHYKPNKVLEIAVGWRHTDRIHNFDTDYVTSSIALNF